MRGRDDDVAKGGSEGIASTWSSGKDWGGGVGSGIGLPDGLTQSGGQPLALRKGQSCLASRH